MIRGAHSFVDPTVWSRVDVLSLAVGTVALLTFGLARPITGPQPATYLLEVYAIVDAITCIGVLSHHQSTYAAIAGSIWHHHFDDPDCGQSHSEIKALRISFAKPQVVPTRSAYSSAILHYATILVQQAASQRGIFIVLPRFPNHKAYEEEFSPCDALHDPARRVLWVLGGFPDLFSYNCAADKRPKLPYCLSISARRVDDSTERTLQAIYDGGLCDELPVSRLANETLLGPAHTDSDAFVVEVGFSKAGALENIGLIDLAVPWQ